MADTPRELVRKALTFGSPTRIPRDLWTLPWATGRYAAQIQRLVADYPPDIVHAPSVYEPSSRVRGDPYTPGIYVDEWGCVFSNLQAGVIGEVKEPVIRDLGDWEAWQPPWEILPRDAQPARSRVNEFCARTDRWVMAGCAARPWERLQFLRGSQAALEDVAQPDGKVRGLLGKIHEFNLREMAIWASTDVDALFFMDDWGEQRGLLINPATWRELFGPLYRDYCRIAHASGKKAFMHSDGNISAIYEDLVDLGVDAVNSQLFSMDIEELGRRVRGRITFWGEIDRQAVLCDPDPEAGRRAVRRVAAALHDPRGGLIAQLELGAGANPEVARAVYEEWTRIPLG